MIKNLHNFIMGTKVGDIIAKLIIKVILKIIDETDYRKIKNMVKNIYEDVVPLPTTLKGGLHVHIGIIMIPELYDTFYQTPYTAPTYQGETPFTPIESTTAELEQILVDHSVILNIFVNDANMDIALKMLLLEAVCKFYLNKIQSQ